jgi:cation:H+ antiporter
MAYILIIIGFIILIKGADVLVSGSSSIARRFNVSDIVIGLTIVAFGTSAPELFVNLVASFQGNTEIAIGNIVGSTIANILLIVGISSLIFPLAVTRGTAWKEIPFSVLAAILLFFFSSDALFWGKEISVLNRAEAAILLFFFCLFLGYSFRISKRKEDLLEEVPAKEFTLPVSFFMIIIGLVGLSLGGNWIVVGATRVARAFHVSDSFIGLTIVAIGTSLPELATSVVAACKKKPDIAIGNIVGSNIFNIFFILGISAMIKPLIMPAGALFDMGVMLCANILLFVAMFSGGKRMIDRWEGAVLVALYCGYIAMLIIKI